MKENILPSEGKLGVLMPGLIKLQNTLRHIMGEDLSTHLGLDYYQELVEAL